MDEHPVMTSDGKSEHPAWRVVIAAPPGGGPGTPQAPPPHPGAEKPKVVWITKRIFVGGGPPPYVASYFCNAPHCSVSTEGEAKGAVVAGLSFRAAGAGASAGSERGKKKPPKWVLVGTGKTSIPGGQTRKLALPLNKTGMAVLEKYGKATVRATIKAKLQGQPGVETRSHTVRLVLKKKKH